jgi:hypothetical protein
VSGRPALELLAALALAASAEAAGTTPRLVNAQVTTRAAEDLQETVRGIVGAERGPLWIGYAVPVDGPHSMCCWESVESIERTRCPGCRLEGSGSFTVGSGTDEGVNLEGDATLVVMLRAEGGRIGRLRTVSAGCALDAGGRPVFWLEGARPADSVRLMASLVEGPSRDVLNGALLALAMHAEPSALDALIGFARRHPSTKVRSQALFWLAQKAGQRATAAITRAIDDDPESNVRQQAVFALSQLPRDEGVPRLITLARGHRDARVREKALFWLGQSGDPRALALFEEILRR